MSEDEMREIDPSEAAGGEDSPQYLATPPEGPRAVQRFGTTQTEQARGEPLSQRLGQEQPESALGPNRQGRLVDPEDEDQPDETPELVGRIGEEAPDDLSAEEAAMHIEEGPGDS